MSCHDGNERPWEAVPHILFYSLPIYGGPEVLYMGLGVYGIGSWEGQSSGVTSPSPLQYESVAFQDFASRIYFQL